MARMNSLNASSLTTPRKRGEVSATVGNPDEILRWLQGSSTRDGAIVDPGGARRSAELALDYVGSAENAATVIEKLHPGRKRLVFVDSRRQAEQLGHLIGGLPCLVLIFGAQ